MTGRRGVRAMMRWTGMGSIALLTACGGQGSSRPESASSPASSASTAAAPSPAASSSTSVEAIPALSPPELDAALAGSAILVIDGRTGRAVFEQREDGLRAAVRPGSIAKIATIAAALDADAIRPDDAVICTRTLTLADGRRADCSHVPLPGGVRAGDALVHSCNVYAATVARRLSRAQMSAAFVRAGLPPVPEQADPIAAALGLDGAPIPVRRLPVILQRVLSGDVSRRHQHVLVDGLRRAATEGTAAAFQRAGISALAKTGTAPMANGHPLGLVIAAVPADAPTHVLVVAVPGGSGRIAAEVAAATVQRRLPTSAASTASSDTIAVGHAGADGYRVERLPLETYVAQAVAGESPDDTPSAARDALAVTIRTYAIANRGRHRTDVHVAGAGFDLCDLTHCQVLRPATAASIAATARTRGRVLLKDGKPVEVFYSASCGGTLAPESTLAASRPDAASWGRVGPDPAGVEEPAWTTEVSARDLLRVLREAGLKGDELRDLRVERETTGRVTRVLVPGLTPSALAADDFRRLVGRGLGWATLKSHTFTVTRTAAGYRFSGRGHGHGVGLCLFGASHLASARGETADRLLATYFPALTVGEWTPAPASAQTTASASVSEIVLRLPAESELRRDEILVLARRALADMSAAAGEPAPARLRIIFHPTVVSYERATGQTWRTSAATRVDASGAAIHLLPPSTFSSEVRLRDVLRHEIVHVLTGRALRACPLAVQEGVAARIAGEHAPEQVSTGVARSREAVSGEVVCPTNADFRSAADRPALARVYARAAACVSAGAPAGQVSAQAWRTWPAVRACAPPAPAPSSAR